MGPVGRWIPLLALAGLCMAPGAAAVAATVDAARVDAARAERHGTATGTGERLAGLAADLVEVPSRDRPVVGDARRAPLAASIPALPPSAEASRPAATPEPMVAGLDGTVEPAPAARAPIEPMPAPPAAHRDEPDAVSPPTRVFVHFSTLDAGGAEAARRLSRHLRDRGFGVADIRAVPFTIAMPRVRYFFADDRESARGLSRAFAEFRRDTGTLRQPVRLEDYAHYRPQPREGNVEVWLPSRRS